MHPALFAIHVANLAPGVELLDDFDRHAGDGVVPGDLVAGTGADPHIDGMGTGRDEARQGQAAGIVLSLGRGQDGQTGAESQYGEQEGANAARKGWQKQHHFADGLDLPYH